LRAYGGDMLGNIWRFDFSPSATATLLGTAKDSSNNPQPITIRPELAELDGKPFVMVGTGRFLGAADVSDTQHQSVYGLRDPLTTPGPVYADPLRNSLRPMAISQTGTGSTAVRTASCTGSTSDCARDAGYVLDLPEAGERVNVEMKLVLGALVFASNVPESVPCSVGGHSWFNQVDFRTAGPIPGAITSEYLSDSLNVGFNVLQLPPSSGQQNPTYTGLFRQSKATNVNKTVHPPEPTSPGRRISWREIAQ
jgi:Tfp pilus tip-associated adhesin PilY1